jgi:hypothetical protein
VIQSCAVIAVEGPQGSGKTTFVHAAAASLREGGIDVGVVEEATRLSEYFVDVMLHSKKPDIHMELHILGTLVAREHSYARTHQVIICDRTVLNVAAYAGLLLDNLPDRDSVILNQLTQFCIAYAGLYDLVVYFEDIFTAAFSGDDALRPRPSAEAPSGTTSPTSADRALRNLAAQAGVELAVAPKGLSTPSRVSWFLDSVGRIGLLG